MSTHLRALLPTPLLNTPHFEQVFTSTTPKLNSRGLFEPLEMIALPRTKFTIEKQLSPTIFQVSTQDYPGHKIFLDSRFTKPTPSDAPERLRILPSKEQILSTLERSLGYPYLWGGNWAEGIPKLSSLYNIPWSLQGLDCSGLLYQATEGYTPRNTSDLLSFGEQIVSLNRVKPLDILIWPGHVIILYNQTTTIESLHGKGVILTPLKNRLSEISHHNFIIRRFI